MIILDYPVYDKNYISVKLFSETLYIAVKPSDPLALKESVTFEELDGTNFLSLKSIGYWLDIKKEFMPHSLFIVQDEVEVYEALQKASNLPLFRTNITIERFKDKEERRYIPITNPEATLTFYGVYPKNRHPLFKVIEKDLDHIPWQEYRHDD